MNENINMTDDQYKDYVEEKAKKSPIFKDVLLAFISGGVICIIGQIPITGFSNSIVSPAIEFKTEGRILGLGANMFKIAGPVLIYGISTSVIVGFIYWIIKLF